MGKRKYKSQYIDTLTKKQKKHLKEFGEEHPFYDKVSEASTQIVELVSDSSSESPDSSGSDSDTGSETEQISAYQKLLSTLKSASDEEDEEDDRQEEDEEEDEQLESKDGADDSSQEHEEEDQTADEDEDDMDFQNGQKREDQHEPTDAKIASGVEEVVADEFTDSKHESAFSLETNFVEHDRLDLRDDQSVAAIGDSDPFKQHMDTELEEDDIKTIQTKCKVQIQLKWTALGQLVCSSVFQKYSSLHPPEDLDLKNFHLHNLLEKTWPNIKSQFLSSEAQQCHQAFTPLQEELFSIINSYKDLYFPESTVLGNAEEVRHVYCLHVLNHVLKANFQVLRNNARRRDQKPGVDDDECRDQGITRPKVLIVVPFRESAVRVVQILISLMEVGNKKLDVSNKKRFKEEFGSDEDDSSPNVTKPEDFRALFAGNVDDHFRIGVGILQRSMRLYAPFYSSDIIIASPLGLRTVIGVEGDVKRDFDFLSSIEILVMDQADVYLMQNWEHVLLLMKTMNLQPLDPHGVDFSRVRMWNLNNWSKYYRQTLLFSAAQDPQINSLFNKHCFNYRGQVAVRNMPQTGSICHVLVQLPHVFQRIDPANFISLPEERFSFFINKVLPQYRDAIMSHTLIYIPSYFDYVRLRNYFKSEELNFTCICEYTKKSGVTRARQFFASGRKQFLLFTERFHFYRRYIIKGIQNLIFYELPTHPHFYSEVCNMLKAANSGEEATWTCTVLYSKYDAQKLAAVVGADRAAQMIQSKKSVHLFVTGDNA
ncbi:U3 small nucleolar RNA-associated protein 25 homolog isoform X2 [Protopterus annectens]|uniref:U3 small nucleolar RNA-associated protein 25 homolog isoform X2 n=1 Tax=Protopterus annectens TaxID=7888 RepID=UPI001CFA7180|nr:U3 small nucleolar RNA-associated protein 25 homolog isoform X2 [Protopterus annectens]